ncbi:SRPBCC family protein [Streptomyces chromofuscus]|uniref:SRPBCC family protein n=1 Tax=Streptomyces chromofuscus TaxID=42881 RepID=A0A7M2T5S4_STRCW|nr:SRPBCC family protein [Streptomyces chromofuscus]QOV43952.1 SRPBCC family protein [Streptomyces chromofuscus]GGT06860.1 cyclase [Streptomyces chromofuscus]
MTDTLGSATSTAGRAARGNPLSEVAHSEAADRLKAEAQEYLAAQTTRVLTGLGRKLGETTGRLNDIAEGRSPGFAKLALDGGRKLAEGKGPLRAALELGASRAKDNVVGAFKNMTGGKGGRMGGSGHRPTVIIEYVDVGVPLRTAYDQWTRYQDFSTFAKGVKSAERADDTTSDWQLKVFWSNRSWKARTTEQVPDDRIAWTSEGAKGTTKGVVSFHRLADNLTRVLLVIEYYPKGLFEKTGNLWRAQGRRARLDLKNFARHITLRGEAEDGWRGEIRDGEVVRGHDEAVAEEEDAERDEGGYDGYDEYEEYDEDREPEEEYEDGEPRAEGEHGPENETEENEEPEEHEETDDEYRDEYAEARSRR